MLNRSLRPLTCVGTLIVCIALFLLGSTGNAAIQDEPRLRRPIALALVDSQGALLVANKDAGSISLIDLVQGQVVAELDIGDQLSDMRVDASGSLIFACDPLKHQLIVLRRNVRQIEVLTRVALSHSPVSLLLDAKGQRCYVASLWSRRLSVVDVSDPGNARLTHEIDLPFAPRKMIFLPAQTQIVVADSFAGNLAVVDVKTRAITVRRWFPGHNIRGLTLNATGDTLLLAHQILHKEESTTHDGVHWGGVMSNVITSFPVSQLLASPSGSLPTLGAIRYLGHPDKAAADPHHLLTTADGRQIVSYAGAGEVAISDRGANYFKTVSVGNRPTALSLDPRRQRLFVANTLSDTISVIDVATGRVTSRISLGPQPPLTLAQQGEQLFHDARLSSDGWYSCQSCHTDGHGNGGLNDNFGDSSYGAPKRVLSLLGVAETAPWSWNGQSASLADQIRASIKVTMQGPKPSTAQVEALAAYVKTLAPPPALNVARRTLDQRQFDRGQALFDRIGCAECHQPPHYTSADTYDVGLRDELGRREFNPPSLRGVSQRSRLFHDNRAATLREVFEKYQHQLDRKLSPDELGDLLHFLRSL